MVIKNCLLLKQCSWHKPANKTAHGFLNIANVVCDVGTQASYDDTINNRQLDVF